MKHASFYRVICAAAIATCVAPGAFAKEIGDRLDTAAAVLTDVVSNKDKGIPADLISKAHCVAVVPGLKKGAFIVGGEYGRGFMSCRTADNRGWTGPASIRVEGGSVGFQIGGAESDVVMLVMNERGAQRLLSSQFTMGADGEVAAGPVGLHTTAQTDAALTAEILSWSDARGVFAGVSLKGATLRQDTKSNQEIYGREVSNKEIVEKDMQAPDVAMKFTQALQSASSQEKNH